MFHCALTVFFITVCSKGMPVYPSSAPVGRSGGCGPPGFVLYAAYRLKARDNWVEHALGQGWEGRPAGRQWCHVF